MPHFTYQARNTAGEMSNGQIEALHSQEALDKLWAKGLLTFSLTEAKAGAKADKPGTRKGRGKVHIQEIALFTRQLATMLKAGLPITSTLAALERQGKGKKHVAILRDVVVSIESGRSLSEALSDHPRMFSKLYVSMVRAGENGGILPELLERLARYMEDSLRLRQKVRSAMMYPTVVCVIAICISLFLVLKIIPIFADIFTEFGAKLPLPTRMLIQFSTTLQQYFVICLIVVAAASYAIFRFKRTQRGAVLWDRCKLRLPIVGELTRKITFTRFARTCAALLRSGVPVLTTLQTTAEGCGNAIIGASIMKTVGSVERGSDLSSAMTQDALFPPMLVEMVAAGELTGRVPEMLEQVAGHYEAEVETMLNGLTSMVEPLLIMVLGTVVGTIVLCMFLPIFKLSEIVAF